MREPRPMATRSPFLPDEPAVRPFRPVVEKLETSPQALLQPPSFPWDAGEEADR